MKTIHPVVSFPEYARFLGDFLFKGIAFPVIFICLPAGKWPSEAIDIRPLIVARYADTDEDPANSMIQLQGEYLQMLFRDSAIWKRVLATGQIRAISFRPQQWNAHLTLTINNELGEVWREFGHNAVGHECP